MNWLLLISEANTDKMNGIVFPGLCHSDFAWLQQDEGRVLSQITILGRDRDGLRKQMNILHGDMDFVTNYTSALVEGRNDSRLQCQVDMLLSSFLSHSSM